MNDVVREETLLEARRREAERRKQLTWRIELGVIVASFAILAIGLILAGVFGGMALYVVAKVTALAFLTVAWLAVPRIYARIPREHPLFYLSEEELEGLEI